MIEPINLVTKFSQIPDHWSPRIAGRVNDCAVKLAKLKGSFIWHHHEHEDELFLVVKGRLRMKLRPPEREVVVEPGEFIIIPRGVEHLPIADDETHVLLFEPEGTLNTGNVRNERTVERLGTV